MTHLNFRCAKRVLCHRSGSGAKDDRVGRRLPNLAEQSWTKISLHVYHRHTLDCMPHKDYFPHDFVNTVLCKKLTGLE
ncbi:MAG: hypothetical protein WDN69_37825 [Aliidongia sp.]